MKQNGVIFLLENGPGYLFSLDQAFRKAGLTNPIRIARYGNEAILYLKGVGIYKDRARYPIPDVMIIDMALPDGSGLSVLGWLRRQASLKDIPLIVLVHPNQQHLTTQIFEGDGNAYFVKRDDIDSVIQLVRDLHTMLAFPAGRTESSVIVS